MAAKQRADIPIEKMLREKIILAKEEAARDSGHVSPETTDGLNRLARVLELDEKTKPPRVSHVFVASLLVGALALSTILLFTHVSQTDIDLDATVTEAAFTLTASHMLSDAISLESLGASGVRNIELPLGMAAPSSSFFHLVVLKQGPRPGQLTLAPLALLAGTRIRLSGGAARVGHISLSGKAVDVHAAASGAVHLDPAGVTADLTSPKEFTFSGGGPEPVDLDLSISGDGAFSLGTHIPVSDLILSRVEESHDQATTMVDRVSTITSGSLFLNALDDREFKLRAGQPLELTGAKGVLRKLTLTDGKIAIRFEGTVQGIKTGAGEGLRTMMPTCLEWVEARHGPALLWGSAIYLFGLAMAVLRWFEIVK